MPSKNIVDFANLIKDYTKKLVHWGDQSKGYVGKNHLHVTQPSIFNLSGVKVTVNSDGSVTFNGTATSNNSFSLTDWTENLFPEGDYLLSDVNGQDGKIFTFIARKKGTSGVVDNTIDTHAMQNKPFTVDYTEYDYYKVAILFFSGQTFNNLTIYPMIRLASIPDSTYEPWYMSNRELTPQTDVVSLESGITKWTANILVRHAKTVLLNLSVSGTFTAYTETLVGTIPSGFRPSQVLFFPLGTVTGYGYVKFGQDGTIKVTNNANVSNININAFWQTP